MHVCQWTMFDIPTYYLNSYLSVVSEVAILIQYHMNFDIILDILTILLKHVNFTSMCVRVRRISVEYVNMCVNRSAWCFNFYLDVWINHLYCWYLVGQFCTFWDRHKISVRGHFESVILSKSWGVRPQCFNWRYLVLRCT